MVIHYVYDMERACAFYRDTLGLVETPSPGSQSPGWSMFQRDGEGPLSHAGLNLQVDDLHAAIAELTAAGGQLRAIREAGGGVPVRLAEVADPDGNGFELRQFVGLPGD